MEEQQSMLFSLGIDEITKEHLTSVAKWNRFLAIAGIVGSVLTIIIVFFSGIYNLTVTSASYEGQDATSVLAGLAVFVVGGVVYLVPCFFRLKFSNKMLKALNNSEQELLNESLAQFKLYSKYWGITTIVSFALIIILIVTGVLSAVMK